MSIKISIIFIAIILSGTLLAQEDRRGTSRFEFTIGPSFSNLLSSEAPHKLDIGQYPTENDLDYNVSLTKDIRVGIDISYKFEYFLQNNLSIVTAISYQTKGIDLKSEIKESNLVVIEKVFNRNIKNSYLIIPVLFRKYINTFYIEGGVYSGFLLKSTIQGLNSYSEQYLTSERFFVNEIEGIDEEKEFTSNFDFGVSLGGGYSYEFSKYWSINLDCLLNIGLIKVDKKYNNEYSIKPISASSNYTNYLITNTNYFGLNSDAKNISLSLTFGVACKLLK